MVGHVFFLNIHQLCLFIGEFNPLTFWVPFESLESIPKRTGEYVHATKRART